MTLEIAQRLIAAAVADAEAQGFRLSFVVVDAAGHPVATARMDGAPFVTPEIAHGKAWTAAAFRLPSAARGEQAKELVAFSSAISAATHGRYTPQIGALPIEIDGEHAGAMGASGAQGHEDEAVVRAAIEKTLG
ncbi:MAG: GlcG/HbpS family heme-binding protein [Solirubrobacteraceae bacterium]